MEWDTAAAHAIVYAAGGVLEDFSKKELKYNKAVLTNPDFTATLKKIKIL